MNELKVIDVDKMADVRSLSGQFYRKPEADKVIEYLQNQLSLARTGLLKSLAKAQREARNSKYKRCLAEANYWLAVSYQYIDNNRRQTAERHHRKWLELAGKLKEELK